MTSLRVMSYNILNGGLGRETHILKVIESARPDVLILQEVYTTHLLKSLSDSLGMTYYLGDGNTKRKVALLSRFPLRSFQNYHPIFPIRRNFIDAEIEYEPAKTIRVVGVHPLANLGIVFEIWRLWEAHYVIGHCQKFKDERCLIAGDFNAIAPNDTIEIGTMPTWLRWSLFLQGNRPYHFSLQAFLTAGFIDCFRVVNPAISGFTLPPPRPNARLDYILANQHLAPSLKKCWVLREPADVLYQASDHYPVLAEFQL